MGTTRHLLILFAAALVLLPAASAAAKSEAAVTAELQRRLGAAHPAPSFGVMGEGLPLHDQLPAFYRQRAFAPAWLKNGRPGEQARALVDLLRSAGAEGLCPEDYHLPDIDALLALPEALLLHPGLGPSVQADLDLLLTDAFLHYASHLTGGRIDPNRAFSDWRARPRRIAPAKLLTSALENASVSQILEELLPPHAGYFALRKALADYRRQWVLGGWPQIPAGSTLFPGREDPRLPVLRQRLRAGGDLAGETASGNRFDEATVAALKSFQNRHGLKEDGILGPKTLAALNVPLAKRIRQIELNLERWRWLPKSLGERYLLVNIADFSLALMADGEALLRMPVVVGTPRRKTPVFSGRLRYLEISPYWYVPPTILKEDLLPELRRDQALLGRRHFEILGWDGEQLIAPQTIDWQTVEADTFPGMLRQQPGPWNPLGRIKFMFPNRFAVYLHDTPDRGLFARQVRSFSSGCIRIERPFELASHLLGDPPDPQLREVLAQRVPEGPLRVDLAESVPVHILYWTAWVTADGRLHFRDDVYWRDLDLEVALQPAADRDQPLAARAGPARPGAGI